MRTLAKAITLALLALASPAGHAVPTPAPEMPDAFLERMKPILDREAFISKVDGELKKLLIPKFEIKDASLSNIVDELNLHIRDHNSQSSVFQIPLARMRLESLPSASSPNETLLQQARVTFSLSNSTVSEVLRYAVSLSGMTIDIEPGAIWLKPLSSRGIQVLIKRVYRMPDSICSTKAQAEKLLTGIIPDYKTTPESPFQLSWNFDESSHLLTLSYGEYIIDGFEKIYARELLNHGFKIPDSASN